MMYLVAIAWLYVTLMMAVAEAAAPNGSLLGASITLLLYGLMPLSIVLYILGTPARKRARTARQRREASPAPASWDEPDAGGHSAGGAEGGRVASVGEETAGVADRAPGR